MMKGPSHGDESLCWPAVRWILLRTVSLPERERLDLFALVVSQLMLLCISDTQGRTRWEESCPSLCPVAHSAGILHSRLRLTAARECSCRYVK
ncbi:hypothetical protein ZWY2020_047091 [Hordeum vulgare]|nr:hypothetical protein ZWY2020_047091 [Hordeum vulgare]